MSKLPVLKLAVAAGTFLSLHAVVVTICALAGVPGMRAFAELLAQFYGPYGYSISVTGIVMGAILAGLIMSLYMPLFSLASAMG